VLWEALCGFAMIFRFFGWGWALIKIKRALDGVRRQKILERKRSSWDDLQEATHIRKAA